MHIRKPWLPALLLAACHTADHPAAIPGRMRPDTAFDDPTQVVRAAAPSENDFATILRADTSDAPIPGDTGKIILYQYAVPLPGECYGNLALSKAAADRFTYLVNSTDQYPVSLKINGRMLHFHLDRSMPNAPQSLYFSGHGYKAAILRQQVTPIGKEDKQVEFTGVLEVKRGKEKVRLHVWGEWGCGE